MAEQKDTPTPEKPPAVSNRLDWELLPFGDRFRMTLNDGQHMAGMIMSADHVRKLRDRCNAVLGEGRKVRKALRRHRHETT